MKKQIVLPWIPDYYTIALYPRAQYFIAHELQSNLWVQDGMMLTALQGLSKRLVEIQLAAEAAVKKGWPIKRTEPRVVLQCTLDMIKKRGIILRGVILEP